MIGVVLRETNVPRLVDQIVEAEALGVPAIWLTTAGAGRDGLTVLSAAAARTQRIMLGTSIMPTWPRHPIALVQQAQVVAALAPGRLRIGLGVGNKGGMESLVGANWRTPMQHMREYVTILHQLMQTGKVDFNGAHFTAKGQLLAPVEVPILVAALRENSWRLAGELSDGAISWMAPWEYLEKRSLPALKAGAAAHGRETPPLVMHVPFCVSTDIEAVRTATRDHVGFYTNLDTYRSMFEDAGFDVAKGLPDALIDSLVVHGDEATVARGLKVHIERGAGELITEPLYANGNEKARLTALRAVAAANV